ncbi:MAG: hypothetical protein FJ104_06040, partial [Deltaproteobacteria bacterium]|nr:hypothetical protein [Deltaproteobacteria bacterium]
SGAGKTTLALALLRLPGAGWATDDAVFLEARAERLRLHGVPAAFHVAEGTLAVVGEPGTALGGALARQPQKRALEVRELFRGSERTVPLAPALLLFPEVAAGVTSLTGLSPPEALARLYRSALFALVDVPAAEAHRDALARLARQSRAIAVSLGPDLLEHPDEVVTRLAAELARPGSG